MAKIIAPNKKYNGISASVNFVNGVGETNDPRLIAWFKSKGYEVVEEEVKKDKKKKKKTKKQEQEQIVMDELIVEEEVVVESGEETPKSKMTKKK